VVESPVESVASLVRDFLRKVFGRLESLEQVEARAETISSPSSREDVRDGYAGPARKRRPGVATS
jgi:hypothetical protein